MALVPASDGEAAPSGFDDMQGASAKRMRTSVRREKSSASRWRHCSEIDAELQKPPAEPWREQVQRIEQSIRDVRKMIDARREEMRAAGRAGPPRIPPSSHCTGSNL